MYISEWCDDDKCFRVETRHGTIVKLCHSRLQALEATVEAAKHFDSSEHERRRMFQWLHNRMRMMQRVAYLKYLRAWRTEA